MKIVLPVSAFDKHLLSLQVEVMEYHGGLEEFDVVLVPSRTVMSEVEPYLDRLRLIAKSANILDIQYSEAGTWPLGPNKHWVNTVYALDAANKPGEPGDCWFWQEMDCWQILPAYKKLADGYARAHAAAKASGKNNFFYGRIVKTPHRTADGRVVHDPEGYDDSMMMGCAVYCAGMSKNKIWVPQANALRDWAGMISGMGQPMPWDVELRTFFRNAGWTHTDLIGDRWNTLNYRIEGNTLKCDAGPTPFKNRAHNETDITGAVMIHGVKDDSLAKLILSGTFGKKAEPIQLPGWTPDVKSEAPAQPSFSPDIFIQKLEETSKMFMEKLAEVQKHIASVEAKISAAPNDAQGEPAMAVPSSAHETKGAAEALDLVGEFVVGKKCMRLSELAKKLKMDSSKLEAMIEGSQDFILQRPLKWVKRKEAA